jgi:hypothetical protein
MNSRESKVQIRGMPDSSTAGAITSFTATSPAEAVLAIRIINEVFYHSMAIFIMAGPKIAVVIGLFSACSRLVSQVPGLGGVVGKGQLARMANATFLVGI